MENQIDNKHNMTFMYAPYLKNSNNDGNQNFGENFCVDFSFGFKFRLFASFLDVLRRFFWYLILETKCQDADFFPGMICTYINY